MINNRMTRRLRHFVSVNAIALLGMVPACAQKAPQAEVIPSISRTCLWNADRRTWAELDLKRWQVHRMKELKLRFPAVVEGQWIDTGDEVPGSGYPPFAKGDTVAASTAGIGGSTTRGYGVNEAGTSVAAAQPTAGLQSELRAVLTTKQLLAWKRICGN